MKEITEHYRNKIEPVFSPYNETPPEFRNRIEALEKLLDDPGAWVREAISIMEAVEDLPDFEMFLVVKALFRIGFPAPVKSPDLFPSYYKKDKERLGDYMQEGVSAYTILIYSAVFNRLSPRLMKMPEVMWCSEKEGGS